jgi:hypothetical protein
VSRNIIVIAAARIGAGATRRPNSATMARAAERAEVQFAFVPF